MYTPISDYLSQPFNAVVETADDGLLGEAAGRLFVPAEEQWYTKLRGVVFPTVGGERKGSSTILYDAMQSGRLTSEETRRLTDHPNSKMSLADRIRGSNNNHNISVSQKKVRRMARPSQFVSIIKSIWGCLDAVGDFILQILCFLFPFCRFLFPSYVPDTTPADSSIRQIQGSVTSQMGEEAVVTREYVSQLAFHPTLPLLAVVRTTRDVWGDGDSSYTSSRVLLYHVETNTLLGCLTHPFQTVIDSIAWKPRQNNFLLLGVRGGLLVWNLMGAGDGKEVPYFLRPQPKITTEVAHLLSKFSFNETAQVLFYRVHRGLPTTSLAFPSEGNTHAVLCGSRRHTEVKGLNLEQSPSDEVHCAPISFIPSFAGGVETLCLTKNDREVLVAVAGQPLVVVCTHWKGSPSFTTVDVPAPVVQFLPAGNATLHESDLYFLRFDQLETIALVQCNPLLGLQVLSFVSTGLYRGVGGIPRRVDCSACRLYILLETGHLLVCHYTTVEGHLHCAPVGVAAVGYVSAMSAIQFDTHCSLLALADKECDVSMIPSFHF